jgi:hypothetical protein
MVGDQDPGSLQKLVQAPLMAVRLGSAHFNDVMIGFPSRRIDGWWECPTVIKVDEITQPWTLSSFLSLVEYYSGQKAAFRVLLQALGVWYTPDSSNMARKKKDAAAVLGRRGGLKAAGKGGKLIAARRSPQERWDAARKAVTARWAKWKELLSKGDR